MARYIDADVLKERLGEIGYEADDLYAMGINRGLDRAETAVDMIPTADVVPRSEVIDDHHKQATCYTIGCLEGDKIKREVAREIFEKIEELAIYGTTPLGLCLMSIGVASFAELKKKYTEGE